MVVEERLRGSGQVAQEQQQELLRGGAPVQLVGGVPKAVVEERQRSSCRLYHGWPRSRC